MKLWSWKKENLPSATHLIRTAAAATISVLGGDCYARGDAIDLGRNIHTVHRTHRGHRTGCIARSG